VTVKGWQDVLTPGGWPLGSTSIIPQSHCGRCHRAGTGQATLEVIGSKRSYALKWRKLNDDDDDQIAKSHKNKKDNKDTKLNEQR